MSLVAFNFSIPFMDQPQPGLSWLLAVIAVILIGIAKSGFGSGIGIVAVPLMVFAFGDGTKAVGALLPILIVADIFSVYHHWGTWDKPNIKVLAPGTAIGLLLGAILLWYLSGMPHVRFIPAGWHVMPEPGAGAAEQAKQKMRIAIGVICLLYIFGVIIKAKYAPNFKFKADYTSGTIAGVSAGVVTTIAHAAGPVTTIYLLGQKLEKQKFIGTAVIYFFTVNLIKLLPFYLLGVMNTSTLWVGLWLVALVPLGTWLGLKLNKKMSDKVFRLTVMVIVFISGVQMIFNINPITLFNRIF